MEFSVHVAQAAAGDVGVDFGSADVGVAEEFLDDAQVCTVFEQVCREAVPEHVRGHIASYAGASRPSLYPQPKRDG